MDTEAITSVVIGNLALIFIAASLFGVIARRLGQPTIIGQIVAGVSLGPTLLGRFPGDPTSYLFPPDVLPFLTVLSQVAIVIFMFVVGYEVDHRMLRGGGRATAMVASAALLVPMALGSGMAVLLQAQFARLGQQNVAESSFILFMGVSTSITALPVLAAIAREKGLSGTNAGTVATTAAGIMDVVAWLVLAIAIAGTSQDTTWSWSVMLGLLIVFVATMMLAVRPAISWWFRKGYVSSTSQVAVALILALGAAWVTSSLGIHAVFGGFLAGLAMPRPNGHPDPTVLRSMEQCSGLLLPLFFVVVGLSVNIGTLDRNGYQVLIVVLVVATVGKLVPAYVASRAGGLDVRESVSVAALTNTRGLTELIVLNVALEAGMIGQPLLTVLVIMALLTTFMTSPLLSLARAGRDRRP